MFSRFHLVKNGEYGYSMFLYKKEAQQFIIDNLEQILSNQPEYSGIIKNRSKIIEAKIPEMEELNVKIIEHGDRNAKREQVLLLSHLLSIEQEELLTLWIADKVNAIIDNENEVADKALRLITMSRYGNKY